MEYRKKKYMEEIKLSILVPTYNHENYIEECVRGILIQKVNFNFEVLIGDDCSTDRTTEVLKKLEPELPDNYVILYREKNLGGRGTGNLDDLIERSRGKYMAILEGDDYWTYEGKLQKQVDFLESHPEYSAVAHNCVVVDQHSKKKDEEYPECKEEEYSFEHYRKDILLGQTATIIYKKEYYKYYDEFVADYKFYDTYAGDRLKAFLLLSMGKVKCMQENWSAYRLVTTQGSSFSANLKLDSAFARNKLLFHKGLFYYAKDLKKEAVLITGKMYYVLLLKYCIKQKKIGEFFSEVWKEEAKWSYLCYAFCHLK